MGLCGPTGVVLPGQDGTTPASMASSFIPFPLGNLDRYFRWSSGLRPSSLRPDPGRGMVVRMTKMNLHNSYLEYYDTGGQLAHQVASSFKRHRS
ncbi:hypothetical protein E2C01_059705 [Portunus trituberculatus]|uniref:Uncharacterized protein n=1 Tax=Portunus trituberculatus TaxID=210409 RepID=A0A5B7H8I5_PORTR|nr:hypothetical protein [Portunus trituberculatus]